MIKILGIKIDNLSKRIIQKKISKFLESKYSHFISTPNPEIILEAQKNEEFFYILNKADISLADGFGLKIAAKLLGKKLDRYTGADLSFYLFKLAEKRQKKVLILNWKKSLSTKEEIESSLSLKYPHLKFLVLNTDRESKKDLDWNKINTFQAEIMLVNFGAYYQEKFIYLNKHKFNNLKIAVGIGGALDFLTNKIHRAPKIMRVLGLEWLWRLYQEPKKRIKRIYKAVLVFSYKVIVWKFIQPLKYRRNVACLLYKKDDLSRKYKILIVERKDEKNHWQLPQGGTEGESLEKAASKEIQEELNLSRDKFKVISSYNNLYKYSFVSYPQDIIAKLKAISGYKGQKQGLVIMKFLGDDKDIKINYFDHYNWQWIDENQLISKVHKHRKEATKIFLDKFEKYLYSIEKF